MKKLIRFATVMTMVTGFALAFSSAAGASAAPPQAAGLVECSIQGGFGILYPGLTTNGQAGSLNLYYVAAFGSSNGAACTTTMNSPAGDAVTGGYIVGSGTFVSPSGGPASSCADFSSDLITSFTSKVFWNASPISIAPTALSWSNIAPVSGTATDSLGLNIHNVAEYVPGYTPTASVGGSFQSTGSVVASQPAGLQLLTNIPAAPPGGDCGTAPTVFFAITGGGLGIV